MNVSVTFPPNISMIIICRYSIHHDLIFVKISLKCEKRSSSASGNEKFFNLSLLHNQKIIHFFLISVTKFSILSRSSYLSWENLSCFSNHKFVEFSLEKTFRFVDKRIQCLFIKKRTKEKRKRREEKQTTRSTVEEEWEFQDVNFKKLKKAQTMRKLVKVLEQETPSHLSQAHQLIPRVRARL